MHTAPHLCGFFTQPRSEQLLSQLKLSRCIIIYCSLLCPQLREQRESIGGRRKKKIPSGPGIPVCSFCYPLKSQTKGPGWTKGEHGWVAQIFSFCQSHFLFFKKKNCLKGNSSQRPLPSFLNLHKKYVSV